MSYIIYVFPCTRTKASKSERDMKLGQSTHHYHAELVGSLSWVLGKVLL